MSIRLTFSQALRLDMERKHLTMAGIGSALGISQQAVHRWLERGFPPKARVNDLLGLLGENSEVAKLDHDTLHHKQSRTRAPKVTNTTGEDGARTPSAFAQAMRLDMERKHLTEAGIGRALGISQQAVHKWLERGFPPVYRIDDLLSVLGNDGEVAKMGYKELLNGRIRSPRTIPPA